MTLHIQTPTLSHDIDLDVQSQQHSGIITIGRKSDEVYNAIAIDDPTVDPFQCYITGSASAWKLFHGQERTECPKGLLSPKLIPCNGCMGRCVNIRAGRPRYYQRTPDTPTHVNGSPVSEWGTPINSDTTITFGNVTMTLT